MKIKKHSSLLGLSRRLIRKRPLAAVGVGMVLVLLLTSIPAVAVVTSLTGDVNEDGKVDIYDLVLVGLHFGEEEQPQYGGTATLVLNADVTYFDEVKGGNYGGHVYAPTTKLTHNDLLQGDWTKGPAGTNETNWINGGDNRMDQKTGCLADSWEIPELGTIIFHIREGVRWAGFNTDGAGTASHLC